VRVALVCSAHGFGHVTRQLVLADALAARGAAPTIFTAAPPALLAGVGHPIVPWVADVGIAQRDSLTEDVPATLARLVDNAGDDAIDALAAALAGFDRVVVDIAPPALEAAHRAGVPAVAVGNFDWAWIYRHYPALAPWAARFAAWQAPHPGLALSPGPGLTGFRHVTPFGVVGRRRAPVRIAERAALVCFGGFGLERLDALLPRVDGLTWVLAPPARPLDRPDVRYVADVDFVALLGGADVVFTKPGYGVFAEAALAGTRMVWVDRGAFPEAPWLERVMVARGDVKVEGGSDGVAAAGVAAAGVAGAIAARLATPRPAAVASDAPERLAAHILGG
jgi:hypothetical protein